eukprot:1086180-Alexandrium_andersonii.AAC.1
MPKHTSAVVNVRWRMCCEPRSARKCAHAIFVRGTDRSCGDCVAQRWGCFGDALFAGRPCPRYHINAMAA